MSIEQKSLSPMGEVLKKEWNNGWKIRCEKEMKNETFIKAFHYSAKNHVKFGGANDEFKKLLDEFIDLSASKKFASRVLNIIGLTGKNASELQNAINQVFCETAMKVDEIIGAPIENNEIKTQLSKGELIELWNTKGLADAVIEEGKTLPIRKALLKVFKEYLEQNSPNIILTQKFYLGIESNITKFLKRLQEILETKTGSYEEIIQTLYNGNKYRIEDFQKYKAKPVTFKIK